MAVYLFENWPFSSIPLPMAGYSIDLLKGRAQNSSRAPSFMFFRCRKSHQVMPFWRELFASRLGPTTGTGNEKLTMLRFRYKNEERKKWSLRGIRKRGNGGGSKEWRAERMSKKMCTPKVLGTNYFTELSKTVLRFWESILSGSITHKPIKITATQAISFLQPATTIFIWSVGLFPWQAGIKIQ